MQKNPSVHRLVFILVALLMCALILSVRAPGALADPLFGPATIVMPDSSGTGFFDAVSCPSATTCVAVGGDDNQPVFSYGIESAGTWAWSPQQKMPTDARGTGVYAAVNCPSVTTCVAVGSDGSQATYAVGILSGGVWSWSTQTPVAQNGCGSGTCGGAFFGVSCPSVTSCVAVGGSSDAYAVTASGAESGGVWTWSMAQHVFLNQVGAARLNSVSCPTTTTCLAVGSSPLQGDYALGTESGGTWTWTTQTGSAASAGLAGVSCVSSTFCVAVGSDSVNLPFFTTATLAGSDVTWTADVMMSTDSSGDGVLTGVSCTTTSTCVAVGHDTNAGAIFSSGDLGGSGWTWSANTPVTPDSAGGGNFSAVSCPQDSDCVAVGFDTATTQQAVVSASTGPVTTTTTAPQGSTTTTLPQGSTTAPQGSTTTSAPQGSATTTAPQGSTTTTLPRKSRPSRRVTPMMSTAAVPNVSPIGGQVALKVQRLPQSATGIVRFMSGSIRLCSSKVSHGVAKCIAPRTLKRGVYKIQAIYSGDSRYLPRTIVTSFRIS